MEDRFLDYIHTVLLTTNKDDFYEKFGLTEEMHKSFLNQSDTIYDYYKKYATDETLEKYMQDFYSFSDPIAFTLESQYGFLVNNKTVEKSN